MSVWTLVALAVALLFLAYKHATPKMQRFTQWLWPGASTGEQDMGKPTINTAADTAPESGVPGDEESDSESTPKASASKLDGAVPSFSLSSGDEETEGSAPEPQPSTPSFPAINSPQRASAMPPPPRPATTSAGPPKAPSSLMPPPPRPTPTPRGPPTNPTASLRVPTTGPLPNRGPPAGSQQRVSASLAPNPAIKTSNSRGKILLKPGHSPMDWAALTRSRSSQLSGVSTFQRVTPSQLRSMTGRKGKPAWSSWQGKVYNITPYVDFHPGGGPEIMKCAGRDGEKLFMETHPWVNWENMLGTCLVGVMVPEGYHDAKGQEQESELEGLD